MNVIICDDDSLFIIQFKKMLIDIDVAYDLNINIKIVDSLQKLELFLKTDDSFDIIFLDIDFKNPDLNGIQFISKVSDECTEKWTLFFVTNYPRFVFDSFEAHPENFLVKPLDKERVAEELLKIKHRSDNLKNKKFVCIRDISSSDDEIIAVDCLISIKLKNSAKRLLYIDTNSCKYVVHDRLNHFRDALQNNCFVQISRFAVINIRHVTSFSHNLVRMDNAESLHIARHYKNAFLDKYSEFVVM
ncbi:LytR/AlgR family response regulator transcription factor [Lactiplantibacillus plantarum]